MGLSLILHWYPKGWRGFGWWWVPQKLGMRHWLIPGEFWGQTTESKSRTNPRWTVGIERGLSTCTSFHWDINPCPLFFLLYPSGILQTSCICLTLMDFLSELPRSVVLTNTQTCYKAPQEHKTPVIYFDLVFFQALISWCFLMVGQEMTSWPCLHCGYSPVLGAGKFCGCVGIYITGITWGLGMFSFHGYTFMRELKSPPAFSCRIPTDFSADGVHKYPLGIFSLSP